MRARTTWLLFAVACAMVGAVMIGVTWALVRLDASRVATEQVALREELVRLSLWRMDSVLTPLLSREIAEAGLDVGTNGLPTGVRARFVIHPGEQAQAVGPVDPTTREALIAMIDARAATETLVAAVDGSVGLAQSYRTAKEANENSLQLSQSDRNQYEYSKRVASVQDNLYNWSLVNPTFQAQPLDQDLEPPGDAVSDAPLAILEMMRPLWWGVAHDELVMIRRVRTAAGERIDGSWLDWPAVDAMLRAEIVDLLPNATLLPAQGAQGDYSRQLATLPVGLDLGTLELPAGSQSRPLQLAIGAAWLFVVVAVGAVAMLLRGSLALSERRAAFVSAVTHELRTPLTTFRMYTEMLSDGMVEDDKRDRYLATLRREAERLGQLVENVLSYARIEADQGGRIHNTEPIEIDQVIARCADRLAQRCEAAGLELKLEVDPEASGVSVRVDLGAIEQIVFNLVDNAAKYGATEARPTIVVRASSSGRMVEIAVCDLGPGVPEHERARVFEPFAKGKSHAAGTKPGVGLGLALSRRLAQQMGGRLELRAADRGANFVLSVPVA